MHNDSNCPDLLSDGLARVADAARFLGVSKSFVYALIRSGALSSIKLGTSRRVPIRAVRDLARNNIVQHPERAG